jgi:hypothetical protein
MLGRVVGLTGLTLALMGAEPARAGDEFEDGFKDELGRIAAHEAVRGGRQILAGILLGGAYAPAAPQPVGYYEPAPPPVYSYPQVIYNEYRQDHHHYYPVARHYDGHGHHGGDHHWRHKKHNRGHRHHGGCYH